MWRHKFLILLCPCTQLSSETIAKTVKSPGTMDFVSPDIFPVAFPSPVVFPRATNFSLPSHFSSGRRKKKTHKAQCLVLSSLTSKQTPVPPHGRPGRTAAPPSPLLQRDPLGGRRSGAFGRVYDQEVSNEPFCAGCRKQHCPTHNKNNEPGSRGRSLESIHGVRGAGRAPHPGGRAAASARAARGGRTSPGLAAGRPPSASRGLRGCPVPLTRCTGNCVTPELGSIPTESAVLSSRKKNTIFSPLKLYHFL